MLSGLLLCLQLRPNVEFSSRTSSTTMGVQCHDKYCTKEKKYLIFSHQPSKTYFKKLFIETNLGKALTRISEDKALPKGLRDEDVERGGIKRPPVPYIPPVDPDER